MNTSVDTLHHYVGAIHELSSPVAVVRQESEHEAWFDQGFEVEKDVTTFVFDDGVVVRRTVEQDSFPADRVCSECWIAYEVISQGRAVHKAFPLRKVFENSCRESFWLSYHRA